MDWSNRMAVEDVGASGFIAIPAIAAVALTAPNIPRGVLVQTAGNMAVQLADGTSNTGSVVAVEAGQILPIQVTRYVTNNTCVLLGLR